MSGQANFRPEEDRPIDGVFMFERILKAIGAIVGVILIIVAVVAAIRLMHFVEAAHGAEVAKPKVEVEVAISVVYRATDVTGRYVTRVFPGVRCPVASGWLDRLYKAERVVDGRTLRACYFATDKSIVVIHELRGVTEIQAAAFEEEGHD